MQVDYYLDTEQVIDKIKEILKEKSIPARKKKYQNMAIEYKDIVIKKLETMDVRFDDDGRGSLNKDDLIGQGNEERRIAEKFKKDKIKEIENEYKSYVEWPKREEEFIENIKVLNLKINEYKIMLTETEEEVKKWKIEMIDLIKREMNCNCIDYVKKYAEEQFEITNELGKEGIARLKSEIRLLVKEKEIKLLNLFDKKIIEDKQQEKKGRLRRRRERTIDYVYKGTMVEIAEKFMENVKLSINKIILSLGYKKIEEIYLEWGHEIYAKSTLGENLLVELNYIGEELKKCHSEIDMTNDRIERNKAIKIWEDVE